MKENFLNFLNTSNIVNLGEILAKFALAYIFILLIAVIFWTFRDINNRSKNISVKLLSIIIVTLFNIFGLIIYLIIRPSKTLKEKSIEDMELKILEKDKVKTKLKSRRLIAKK